ncbi:MAG: TIM barrel protein [Planctomycetia bacterium]
MQFAYVLPDPASYGDWAAFAADVACVKQAGYDAVELQITDPAAFDEDRVRRTLDAAGLPMCAFQTGGSYATRGNCLSTADAAVRDRTEQLLLSFVDLAARWRAVMVFGSLQGRLRDEPDRATGAARIRAALARIGTVAASRGVTLAFEPVNQLEVGFHNTIAEAAALVRGLALPGIRLMVDSFHMNIEERDMASPLADVRDLLAHVHLVETNRGPLGAGHLATRDFLDAVRATGYRGYCSAGVFNSSLPRADCIRRCMDAIAPPDRRTAGA